MKTTLDQVKDKLLQPAFESKAPVIVRMSDPIVDTPMVLTLDETLPYDTNPRTTRNPKYDEIKESIRQRGLDTPPPVTRRPGEDKFRIRNGGNTRLAILNELFRETGDDKFFRFHCLFRPWDAARGEIIALTGHLAENDLQGQLKFIERALGVEQARRLYEDEVGSSLSQSELARRLKADGYPISQPHISKMQDAIRYLLPAIPALLYSGLGKPQIERLLALRKTALQCWQMRCEEQGLSHDFDPIFMEVLSQFEGDAEEFLFQRCQDELIHNMRKPLGLSYETVLLDITQNHDQLRRSTPVLDIPAPARLQSLDQPKPNTTADEQALPAPTTSPDTTALEDGVAAAFDPFSEQCSPSMTEEQRDRIDGHVVSQAYSSTKIEKLRHDLAELNGEDLPDFATNALVAIPIQAGGLNPISDLWYIEREIDNPATLRDHIAQLAREIIDSVHLPGAIQEVDSGIGFSYQHPDDDTALTDIASHTLTLLQALSGSVGAALRLIQDQPALQLEALKDFKFAAGLGQLLLGPLTPAQSPDVVGSLSDEALVKLFRIIRLARRLIELERQSVADVPALADPIQA